MSTKRSELPPITPEDIQQAPERVRTTPNGGHAWKCHYCGLFASSATQKGLYVCRRHGGVPSRKRDPLKRATMPLKANKSSRPSGRPIIHGKYSKSELASIDEIVADYAQRHDNILDTQEDLRMLKAYQELLIQTRPNINTVHDALLELSEALEPIAEVFPHITDAALQDLLECVERVYEGYVEFQDTTKGIEVRYERLIKAYFIQATTRVKNFPAEQLMHFQNFLHCLLQVYHRHLAPEDWEVLQHRYLKEFTMIPKRLLELDVIATEAEADSKAKADHGRMYRVPPQAPWLLDAVEKHSSIGNTSEQGTSDLRYLRAYVQQAMLLEPTVRATYEHLHAFQDACASCLQDPTFLPDHREEVLPDLQKGIRKLLASLQAFWSEQEARHFRIIRMADLIAATQARAKATENLKVFELLIRRARDLLWEYASDEVLALGEADLRREVFGDTVN